MAKNLVAAGFADKVEVQMAYAIGVAEPLSIYVNTFGTAKVKISDADLADKLREIFDMRPGAIEKRLGLRNPIYEETAAYGHMGRTPRVVKKRFDSPYEEPFEKEVELFTWEKLDYMDRIKKEFGL
jgi:S-adenosylmethionine synthetase